MLLLWHCVCTCMHVQTHMQVCKDACVCECIRTWRRLPSDGPTTRILASMHERMHARCLRTRLSAGRHRQSLRFLATCIHAQMRTPVHERIASSHRPSNEANADRIGQFLFLWPWTACSSRICSLSRSWYTRSTAHISVVGRSGASCRLPAVDCE